MEFDAVIIIYKLVHTQNNATDTAFPSAQALVL